MSRDALVALGHLVVGLLLAWAVPEVGVVWWQPTPGFAPVALTIALACLAQVLRRRYPVLALAGVTLVFLGGAWWVGASALGLLIVLGDVLYCAVLHSSKRAGWAVAGTALLVLTAATLATLVSSGGRAALLNLLGLSVLVGIPVLWALEVRRHRDLAVQARLLAERDRAAALVEERNRMARDLHDVVAGRVSAIALQSAAALGSEDPATLRRVLGAVREHSVASLGEMRTMIELLRSGTPDPHTAPDGLDRLGALLTSARAGGLSVRLDDTRTAPLPAAVDLAAYRIVQEGLTNAAKHAPGSTVDITVSDGLVVELRNDLTGGGRGAGTGTGLLGLRERASAVGGSVVAGPADDGWRLRAELPVGTA